MKSALPGILRLVGIILAAAGVILGVLDAYGMARMPVGSDVSMGSRLPGLAGAVAMVLGLVGLGILLYALAELLEAKPAEPVENKGPSKEVAELGISLQRLEASIQRLADQHREQVNSGPAHLGEMGVADTMDGTSLSSPESVHQIMTLLQEIRELALMSESQRQDKLAEAQQHRRNFLVAEAQRLVELRDWAGADSSIENLEREFPDGNSLDDLKDRMAAGKKEAEQGAIVRLRERVEDLMAVWAWDQAYAEVARFVENFPDHQEGRQLLDRVMTERENYAESTANRLFDEIRTDIDRRMWRRAMTNAVKLLECAPGHRKSVAIRGQLKTIRENAEIEERQEQERRIQDLIRNKQFFEAIDLAEDLLQRFPNSPQADSLQKLLPKMRELAIGDVAESHAETGMEPA
jgi:outer membrane protein assembly factor BamD (BamD/ComL family)